MKYLQYKENTSRGTFDFPLEYYHVIPSHPRYDMSYHWHTESELMRILKGSFTMNLDGKEYLLKEGDAMFIHGGLLHGGTPHDCVYECIVFDMRLLAKDNFSVTRYLQDIINHQILVFPLFPNPNAGYQRPELENIRSYQAVHKNLWQLFASMQKKSDGYELTVLGLLYQLFGTIISKQLYWKNEQFEHFKNHERIQQLKNALALIENSYSEQLSLEDLSKAAGMSPKYFCRFFQEMTHRTPIDYLNYYRIECACIQLVTTGASITEVAFDCGFNDTSYFIKTFKKYKGTTPHKYLRAPF